MPQAPYYDGGSGTVHFHVAIGDRIVAASITKATLHYRFHSTGQGDEPLATYAQHASEIDAAVRRRIEAGARDPVMLRDPDVRAGAATL